MRHQPQPDPTPSDPQPESETGTAISRRQAMIAGGAALGAGLLGGGIWLASRDGDDDPGDLAALPTMPASPPPPPTLAPAPTEAPPPEQPQRDGWESLREVGIAELSGWLRNREITATALVQTADRQIRQHDNLYGAVIELNPDALIIAAQMDTELAEGSWRGPLHGVPVLLKDVIATGDRMHTTAGSLALENNPVSEDATIVRQLREAGAVILGKTNMTEWSNIRHGGQTSGWSDRGGQTRNPYNPAMSPWGSSSGSAAAVALSYVPIALGAETNGSIICPAAACGVVGLKPTVGLVSRAGVMPVSRTFDSPGPMGRTVADVAVALSVLAGRDPDDPGNGEFAWATPAATAAVEIPGPGAIDYTAALDPDALRGARLGVCWQLWGMDDDADALGEQVLEQLRAAGAEIIEGVEIPALALVNEIPNLHGMVNAEFASGMQAFFDRYMPDGPIRSLADVVAWNNDHDDLTLTFAGQNGLAEATDAMSLDDPTYRDVLAEVTAIAREQGMDLAMDEHDLDALIAPTAPVPTEITLGAGTDFAGSSARAASLAGYPSISIPMGMVRNLPVGLHLSGRAFSEERLLAIAYSIEQLLQARVPPRS